MKLRMITESSPSMIIEMSHRMWRERGDKTVMQQSTDNLILISLQKIRNMLGAMGLTKNPIQKHRVTEPITAIAGSFDKLRTAVRTRAYNDAMALMNNKGDRDEIEKFWGIKFPKGYYDASVSQFGSVNVNGTFDDMIRQTVSDSEDQPLETKIELLHRLATALS